MASVGNIVGIGLNPMGSDTYLGYIGTPVYGIIYRGQLTGYEKWQWLVSNCGLTSYTTPLIDKVGKATRDSVASMSLVCGI